MATTQHNEIDQYIAGFPQPTQELLKQMRATILKAAPEAEELIGYQMPAYRLHGPLVYFAGYKAHIGLYPSGSGIEAFKKELSVYKNAKGSVQFPLDKPLPVSLITKIVKLRVKENQEKAKMKEAMKKAAKKPAKKVASTGSATKVKKAVKKSPAKKGKS